MENINPLEIIYFERLKIAVQEQYNEFHTPSHDDISKWKGIDIVYFQEDLRKKAKGNISEKSFYTYFKSQPVKKLPRIDMLNLLSIYIGYESWFDFKKVNPIDYDIISPEAVSSEINHPAFISEIPQEDLAVINTNLPIEIKDEEIVTDQENTQQNTILQTNTTEKQTLKELNPISNQEKLPLYFKKYMWLTISSVLFLTVLFLVFRDQWLTNEFQYSFIDADRNTKINAELDVKIIKDKESPILFRVKPNESFIYTTKNKSLTMIVSSPFYKTDTITRNLENAPEAENIELKPNDYAIQLYYYSKSIKDLKKKRERLSNLISDNALIYQVFDNDTYGVETLDKQKYLALVTLPTTALENLNVIETQMKNGKIIMIKFKIDSNEQ